MHAAVIVQLQRSRQAVGAQVLGDQSNVFAILLLLTLLRCEMLEAEEQAIRAEVDALLGSRIWKVCHASLRGLHRTDRFTA